MPRAIELNIGDKFGSLTVISSAIRHISKSGRKSGNKYECMCECGNAGFYRGNHLVNKYSTQCKICGYKTRPQSALKVSAVERLYNLSIVGRCKKSDRLDNNLPLDEYAKIIKNDCYYCGEPPRKIEHVSRGGKIVEAHTTYANGIDRVDSSLGYSVENCVACCPSCNTMKMDMSIGDFMNKIIQIYNKWELKGTM